MQDRDIPPEVEGEAGGGADAVRPTIAAAVVEAGKHAIATTQGASTPPRWITAIVPTRGTTTTDIRAAAAPGPGFQRLTAPPTPNRCRCGKTRPRASSLLSMTCFSWPRSRKQRAR